MKKLIIFAALLFATSTYAQNPICITVTDAPCDANVTSNGVTNPAGNALEDLYLYYDTGSTNNRVYWRVYADTQIVWTGSACGCGTAIDASFFTDAQHVIKLEIWAEAYNTAECNGTVTTTAKLYTPKEGNACYEECD